MHSVRNRFPRAIFVANKYDLLETDDAMANDFFESYELVLQKEYGIQIEQLKSQIENFEYVEALETIDSLNSKDDLTRDESKQNVINRQVLEDMFGKGSEKSLKFLKKFLPQAEVIISQIKASFKDNDIEQVGFLSHKLKSSARAVGAEQLGAIFERLEFAGKAGDDSTVKSLLSDIEPEMIRVTTYINKL